MISLTSPIETPFHGLPAGFKLLALCAFTFAIFLTSSFGWHLVALAAVGGLHLFAGLRFALLATRRLFPIWPFIAVVLAWHIATYDPLGGLVISIRLVAAVGLANLVTMTTRLDDMLDLLRRLLAPLERRGARLAGLDLAVALVMRFTPAFIQKGTLLVEAWRSRSRKHPGWRIALPMTLLAMDDAEHVSEALHARCGGRESERPNVS